MSSVQCAGTVERANAIPQLKRTSLIKNRIREHKKRMGIFQRISFSYSLLEMVSVVVGNSLFNIYEELQAGMVGPINRDRCPCLRV